MALGAVGNSTPVTGYQPLKQTQQNQPTQKAGQDNDADEANESAKTKAKEAKAASTGLPVDTNRGRNLNILA